MDGSPREFWRSEVEGSEVRRGCAERAVHSAQDEVRVRMSSTGMGKSRGRAKQK